MNYTQFIKSEAKKLGFLNVGISKVRYLEEEKSHLHEWLSNNRNGTMKYMENHFDKRLDPSLLFEGAKSIVSLIYNYYPKQFPANENSPIISKYAYGTDYHFVLKKKLKTLLSIIKNKIPQAEGRVFVDSAPILEKKWAELSNLGWIGKNSLLITKKYGSFVFISEIILNISLEYDKQHKNYCGNCNLCISSCPTQAISIENGIDARKCISYLTIENKHEIPSNFKTQFQNRIFGCDICQDVCPWNKFAIAHNEPEFEPHPSILSFTKEDWQKIDRNKFNEIFKNSAVKRTKFQGFKRNLDFVG